MTDLAAMTAQLAALDRMLHGRLPLRPAPVTHVEQLPSGASVQLTVDTVTMSLDAGGDSALYETYEFAVTVTGDHGCSTGTVTVAGVTASWDLAGDGDPLPIWLADDLGELFVEVAAHEGPAPLVAQLQAAHSLDQLHDAAQMLAHLPSVATLLAHCPGAATAATLASDWTGTLDELADAADRLDTDRHG